MKILVTGGAGFIGSHLCERLLAEGYKVIALDNFDPYYGKKIKLENLSNCVKNKNFKLLKGDIRDANVLKKIFKGNQISHIVHLAAKVGVRPSVEDPFTYLDVNVNGTVNLLEQARKYDVENFIFGSSSSVYGEISKIPFKEDYDVNPISPYGASKRAAEILCRTYNYLYGIRITCLRFFTVYGPRQRPDMAIHKFTKLIDEGKEVPIFGSENSKRDYTYISDIIDGIVKAIRKVFDFEIFNLGNSKPIQLKYLLSLIEKELGKKAKIKQLGPQKGDVTVTYADISKARKKLGYEPKISIEEGIKKFVEWYKNKVG